MRDAVEEKNRNHMWKNIGYCSASLLLSTGIDLIFERWGFSDANLIMTYILGNLIVALFTDGYIWGLIYSILGVLTFNFFFAAPVFTFSVYNPNYIVTFIVMFVTFMICSMLTKKVKDYAYQNAKKSYRSELLLKASRSLQTASTTQEIAQKIVEQLGRLLEKRKYSPFLQKRKKRRRSSSGDRYGSCEMVLAASGGCRIFDRDTGRIKVYVPCSKKRCANVCSYCH